MLNWFKRRAEKVKTYRSNEEWVKSLSAAPEEDAVKELRRILIRGLKPALYRYVDRELDQFAEDVAQDALIKILANIHTFRGESHFISWAMKVAVREGLSELRRKKWKDISLQDLAGKNSGNIDAEIQSEQIASDNPGPDQATNENMILSKVMEIIENELSIKQKMAIKAIMIEGVSMSVVAEQMGTNRNALYKLIHDARVNLKKKMEAEGMDPDEILKHL